MKTIYKPFVKKPHCVTPNCTRATIARGLCSRCHYSFLAQVKAHPRTEAKLIREGRVLPKGKPGRKPWRWTTK